MEIHYCAKCGDRIAPEDVEAGRAGTTDGFNFHCERCTPARAASGLRSATGDPRGRSSRLGSPIGGTPRPGSGSALRQRSVEAKQAPGNRVSLPLAGAGLLALCGLMALAVYAFGGSSKDDPNRSTTPPASTTVSGPAKPQLPDPVGPATPAIPAKPDTPAVSGKSAQEDFDALVRFDGLAADDRTGRIARIEKFLERHGQSLPAARARVLLNDLRKPDNGVRDHTIFIKVGVSVTRTLEQVKAAHGAYGPKQDVDPASGETHIYLPYGNNPDLYFGEFRVVLEDAHDGRLAELRTPDSSTAALLTYKLQFDKPISGFRFHAQGQVELDLEPTCVAGLEYSTDGVQWKPVHEYKGTEITVYKIFGPFIENASITGLRTQTLYLRYYSRDSANPQATNGKRMWLKLWMSGDPAWGDAATTFFANQGQIWVKEAK